MEKFPESFLIFYVSLYKIRVMSPTVLIKGKFRFFFNSREETRRHIHVSTAEGTAKIWLEPYVGITESYNMNSKDLTEALKIVEDHQDEFISKWNQHFNV